MSEKKPEYCTYTSVKLDSELIRPAKGVALLLNTTLQEWLSDLVNDAVSEFTGKPPAKRRKAPPPGRPPDKKSRKP
jgi:hypothetical protein